MCFQILLIKPTELLGSGKLGGSIQQRSTMGKRLTDLSTLSSKSLAALASLKKDANRLLKRGCTRGRGGESRPYTDAEKEVLVQRIAAITAAHMEKEANLQRDKFASMEEEGASEHVAEQEEGAHTAANSGDAAEQVAPKRIRNDRAERTARQKELDIQKKEATICGCRYGRLLCQGSSLWSSSCGKRH